MIQDQSMLTVDEIAALRQDKVDAIRLTQGAFNHLVTADRLPALLERQTREQEQWAADGWTPEAARERMMQYEKQKSRLKR